MNTVYKYVLFQPGNPIVVPMPRFAKILHVGNEYSSPAVWALVHTSQPSEKRTFFVYGTGHEIEEEPWMDLTYLGTCETDNAGVRLVWHVFEKPIERNVGELLLESVGIPKP